MSIAAAIHRRISPFTMVGRLIRAPLRLIPGGAVLPVLGGINRGYRWVAGSATASCWIGSYEEDHQLALKRLVGPGTIAYDVGANVGFHTLALSRLVGPTGHVYAFEPEARNVALLSRHLELNGARNVTVIQAAISDRTELVCFARGREQGRIVPSSDYLVPSVSLDDFIAAGHPAPSFVKMDIEGAERLALGGASSLVARRETSWMMATHSAVLRETCIDHLSRSGYTIMSVDFTSEVSDAPDFLCVPR